MKRDTADFFSPLLLGIISIFIKIFVLVMVVIGIIWGVSSPNPSPVTVQTTQSLPEVPVSTATISPQDAAIANSEWSGALTAKPSSQPVIPVIIPTIPPTPTSQPTAIVAANNNNPAPVVIPTEAIGSPLEGFAIKDLQSLISQNFQAPPPGEDSGHHGVDFAFWTLGDRHILGTPIQAVFPGKVSMADTQEKPPYGYSIMIETPLNTISGNLIQAIKIPTQPIVTTNSNKLNCPDLSKDVWNSSSKSLYTLYGHLVNASSLKQGDTVQLGQVIGHVGNSGYSSAPHLHLEMRIGPSGAAFQNMGHYDPITTEEDRHNYCNWRVSGVFQMFDPMDLFKVSMVTK